MQAGGFQLTEGNRGGDELVASGTGFGTQGGGAPAGGQGFLEAAQAIMGQAKIIEETDRLVVIC